MVTKSGSTRSPWIENSFEVGRAGVVDSSGSTRSPWIEK